MNATDTAVALAALKEAQEQLYLAREVIRAGIPDRAYTPIAAVETRVAEVMRLLSIERDTARPLCTRRCREG